MTRTEIVPRRRAAAAWRRILPQLSADAEQRLGHDGAVAFLARLELHLLDAYEPLDAVYGADHDTDALLERLVRITLAAAGERPADLRDLDRRREIDRQW